MAEQLHYKAKLVGHNGWVTAVATSAEKPDMIISSSRDKTLMVWQITRDASFAYPLKSLTGHNHFVQDVVLSSDGQFALSASWDSTLRLWDLTQGKTHRRFVGHSRDVLSVAFSPDNRQILSGSRDNSVKVWNTLGECKFNIKDHTDWVSCVKFSPSSTTPLIVTGGWDKVVKVWELSTWKPKHSLVGHKSHINTVTVSPDGSLCASGGEDGTAMLWDLAEGKHLYSLEAGNVIHALVFSPNRYWLCAATQSSIKLWDLESKNPIADLKPENMPQLSRKAQTPHCISLAWSADGNTLFAGFTDNNIHVWTVSQ